MQQLRRVTKTGGHILVAYCMNEGVVVQECFRYGNLKKYLEKGILTEDLFEMVRVEDIYALTENMPVKREKLIATDGERVAI